MVGTSNDVATSQSCTSALSTDGASTGIKTRYSFYEAEDYNDTTEEGNTGPDDTSEEVVEEDSQVSPENRLSQDTNEVINSLKSNSCASGCTETSASSSGVEDILRNLSETEQLGLHNNLKTEDVNDSPAHGRVLSHCSAAATAGAPSTRDFTNLSSLDVKITTVKEKIPNPLSNVPGNSASMDENSKLSASQEEKKSENLPTSIDEDNTKRNYLSPEKDFETMRSQESEKARSPVEDTNTETTPIGKIVKEALHLVRARGQKRAAMLKVGFVNVEDCDSSHLSTGAVAQESSCNLTPSREEEWKTQMATYVAALSNSQTDSVASNAAITEMSSTSDPVTKSLLPLPLHPSGDRGKPLIPATKLDNRLLSPPVDVRKTVAGFAAEMFRLNGDTGECNVDASNSLEASFNSLALANPVYSQITPGRDIGNGSPVHTSEQPSLKVDTISSLPSFTVVPSSPAPGKFNLVNEKNSNTNMSHADDSTLSVGSATQSQARRAVLELERRWRREEEIERGVEKVLISILERANKSVTILEGKDNHDQSNWIDQTFSSVLEGQSVALLCGAPKIRTTRVPSEGVVDQQNLISTENSSIIPKGETSLSSRKLSSDDEKDVEASNSSEVFYASDASTENNPVTKLLPPLVPPPQESKSEAPATRILPDSETSNFTQKKTNVPSIRHTSSLDGDVEVEAVDRDSEFSSESGHIEQGIDKYDKVLGPLSKEEGGTTGVVLQCDGEDNGETFSIDHPRSSSSVHEEQRDASTVPSAGLSPSILESITSAVRRGPTDIIAVLSGEASVTSRRENGESKYGESDVDEDHIDEKPTHILAKDLYAHLLPIAGSGSHKRRGSLSDWLTEKIGGISSYVGQVYAWDDDDPDEPGYVTHTLTRSQLKRVEQEYENMLRSMKEKNTTSTVYDREDESDMECDLLAAELVLDRKEKKKSTKVRRQDHNFSYSTDTKNKSSDDPVRCKSKVSNPLSTNSNFPVAKAAGTGEEGELELYHLPIIYKAHQTGFEPTKDLVLQPDTVFAGKYYVQSELGSAAFSTAYRCVDLNSGKEAEDEELYYDEVCLKVIKNTKDFFDQSLDEIKILELLRQTDQCNEQNILEMKTFFYHKEHLIIVTELLRQNLFEFGKYIIENDEPRYFTRQRLGYIARQCLVALSFVHNLGLVHSDIKPENILLASYSRAKVKVIDFGSSCYLSDRQSSYIQSRSYRAPEVVLGLPYDGKIDVWSLGCVIAEMYTGQVTFQNDSVVSMLSRIEAICGAFPRYMVETGRQSGQFFTPSGLLYEKIDVDDENENRMSQSGTMSEDDSSHVQDYVFNVFQPKMTTMSARLGFEPNLLEKRNKTWEDEERALFVDFVKKLLTIDPDHRPSASEALDHPWILSGYNVSEEELKYPPED